MSAAIVKAFFEKVEGDKGLQAKLKEISDKGLSEGSAIAEVVQIAKAEGFEITAADVVEARKAFEAGEFPSGDELSLEELETVAGGRPSTTGCCMFARGCMPGFRGTAR
jgi:predicted ribosomally synthesized peptide with nif11-like leader